MSLTPSQKKKLNTFRSWVNKERRVKRINAYPPFSYSLEERQNKIILCYSVNEMVGYNTEKDEAIYKRKKKKKYLDIHIKNYKDVSVKVHYELIKREVEKQESKNLRDEESLPHHINEYVNSSVRYGKEITEPYRKQSKVHLDCYVEWLRKNSPRHLDIYEHIIDGRKVFEKYMSEYRQTKSKRDGKPIKKNTIAHRYRGIKLFFNYMNNKDQRFPFNMLKLKGMVRETRVDKMPPAVSRNDIKKLSQWIDKNKENKYERWFIPILRTLILTGARIGEICKMKIEDINLETREWNFYGKSKRRSIFFDDDTLWTDLKTLIIDKNGDVRTDKKWVFHHELVRRKNPINGKGGGLKINLEKHFSTSGVSHKFKEVVKEIGLDESITPHACRRGFITIMLEDGRSIQEIATMCGHSSYDMVIRYSRQVVRGRNTLDISKF